MSNQGPRRTAPAAEESMPPGGGGGGEHGCAARGHPPATGCDEDAPPAHPPPLPFPATEEVSLQMKKKQKQEHEQQPTATASIPEGPLVEILSRVPYRSLCRFKCVSKPWLALCSDPQIRKRCPQTLAGFFYNRRSSGLSFCNVSGRGPPMVDPSLPFLRGRYKRVEVEHCCGGLLLCKYWEKSYKGPNQKKYGYAVCNPVTEQWNVLPDIRLLGPEIYGNVGELFLALDAANPSRFLVFVPLSNASGEFVEAAIFSSETQGWTAVDNEWGEEYDLVAKQGYVLLNGILHVATRHDTIVMVDMKGEACGQILMPYDIPNVYSLPSIGKSQGCLYAWHIDDYKLYVWVLEDYASGEWTLKHTANVPELFGRQLDEDDRSYSYKMFAIHPDRNLVFLTDKEKMTLSYDMDTRKVDVICSSGEFLGGAPYVPCFTELLLKGIAASCTERRTTL